MESNVLGAVRSANANDGIGDYNRHSRVSSEAPTQSCKSVTSYRLQPVLLQEYPTLGGLDHVRFYEVF
jgi:hypothetical protein